MILISNDFWDNIKIYNFNPYNVFLVIATWLMTAFVLQGHIFDLSFDNVCNSNMILTYSCEEKDTVTLEMVIVINRHIQCRSWYVALFSSTSVSWTQLELLLWVIYGYVIWRSVAIEQSMIWLCFVCFLLWRRGRRIDPQKTVFVSAEIHIKHPVKFTVST